jgi:hypothetical protein
LERAVRGKSVSKVGEFVLESPNLIT